MLILNWQELVPETLWKNYHFMEKYPWPGSILAASIPIHSPHTLFHVSEKQLQILEILQGRILLPGQAEVEEVMLPLESIAFIWHNNKVDCLHEGEPKDLGLWLQKYGTWSSSHKLIIFTLQEFPISFVYKKNYQGNIGSVALEAKIKVDRNALSSFVNTWLRSRCALHLHEIFLSFETCLEENNFLCGFSHNFEKIFLDESYRQQVFPAEAKLILENFQKKGLLLSFEAVEWHWKKARQTQAMPVASPSGIPYTETVTQKIERQRVEKIIEDVSCIKNKKEKEIFPPDRESKFFQ